MKKLICVSGKLLLPLQVGNRAVILNGGDCIYTSRVVEILKETAEVAYFETMNSVYKVSLAPVPIKAALPADLAMCA